MLVLAVVPIVLCPTTLSGQVGGEEAWRHLRPLVGEWKGTGTGFGGVSEVSHQWKFVLGGRFLELRTRSVPGRDGKADEVHEDVGFISRDTGKNAFVFRQFLSEGFVNTYDVSIIGGERPGLSFEHRETESAGGMRARMRLLFVSDDEYEMVLELASPGEEFAPCQRMHMTRTD